MPPEKTRTVFLDFVDDPRTGDILVFLVCAAGCHRKPVASVARHVHDETPELYNSWVEWLKTWVRHAVERDGKVVGEIWDVPPEVNPFSESHAPSDN